MAEPKESSADRLRRLIVTDPLEPSDQSKEACILRLKMACQLSDDGMEMMRMNFKRRQPESEESVIDELMRVWLEREEAGCDAFRLR